MTPVRTAFVMEQTLGHVTHHRNLRQVVAAQDEIAPFWLPIAFDVQGAASFVPVLRSNWSVRASWRARRALDGLMSRQTLDAVLFHTQVTALFSQAIMRQVPAVISLDATPINYDTVGEYYGHRAAGRSFLDQRKHGLNASAYHAATALVTWSQWARRSLVDDYGVDPDRVRVIAPGAAPSYFELGETRPIAQRSLDGSRVRLLFVGGNFRRKGGQLLLEALNNGLGERFDLDVVTQEPIAPQRNVTIHTGIGPNSPELSRLFAAADIFVLPTLADCLPMVLMEAAAAGLPVVATDVGALKEAFLPQASGLLVPAGDVPALAASLRALADDAPLRQAMGRAGHALACARFDARRNNQLILDLITTVAHDSQATRRAA